MMPVRSPTVTIGSIDEVRARIAALITGSATDVTLGSIELKPHQRTAVVRIHAAMREFGGALLADETGLGKTYVALSVARESNQPIVVAPAALRSMWHRAAAEAGITLPFVSIEGLSRSARSPSDALESLAPDLVIVDEAHHLRNPATARYRALARMTARARVLLLSATPVHNATPDLAALLALFLGARASRLSPEWMARCIIRRGPGDAPLEHLPPVESPGMLPVAHDERHLDAILALPPPVPPIDGGDGGILLTYSLIRQWASSQGALVEALRRRLARATALLAGLEAGRHPSASELGAWAFADGSMQLAFPELMIADTHAVEPGCELAACVRAHAAAVRSLVEDLEDASDPDRQRAAHLIALRTRHPGAKIVAFTQYAETVNALFRLLRIEAGIAAMTADGGRVAGGALTRAETLARFAPHAQGAVPPGRAHRIDMLITTDLLSEGVNLQDASVVVHLDLPWTPARLEQRVGRVARIGSAHERVFVYVMLPPASSERIVGVEQRLRDKLRAATRAVGVVGTILPSLVSSAEGQCVQPGGERPVGGDAVADHAPAGLVEAIRAIIATWRSGPASDPREGSTATGALTAAVHAHVNGFLAVLGDVGQPRLLADVGAGPTDDASAVLEAVNAVTAGNAGAQQVIEETAMAHALDAIAGWRSSVRIQRDLTVDGALHARARRSVVDRIAAITRRTPRHLRPAIAALAMSARRTVTTRYGAGAERVLDELAAAAMPDEAWLRAVSTFGSLHGTRVDEDSGAERPLLALILLRRVAAGPSHT